MPGFGGSQDGHGSGFARQPSSDVLAENAPTSILPNAKHTGAKQLGSPLAMALRNGAGLQSTRDPFASLDGNLLAIGGSTPTTGHGPVLRKRRSLEVLVDDELVQDPSANKENVPPTSADGPPAIERSGDVFHVRALREMLPMRGGEETLEDQMEDVWEDEDSDEDFGSACRPLDQRIADGDPAFVFEIYEDQSEETFALR